MSPSATLGQPLGVLIPIHLDQGERLFAECVRAEVMSGDVMLPPNQVRVAVSPTDDPAEWTARVSTVAPIEEPLVEISVSAGCERRFMRRFTAFADPPNLAAPAAAAATSATMAQAAAPARGLPGAVAAASAATAAVASADASVPAARTPASHATARHRPADPASVPTASLTRKPSAMVHAKAPAAQLLLDVGSGPRLKMDMEDPIFMPAAAVDAAAAGASSGDASADLARLQVLEKTLGDLQRESRASQASESGLKARLAEAEGRSRVLPWLLGLLVLAVGVALWLAWRLRFRGHQPEKSSVPPAWWSDAAETGIGPVPEPPPSVLGDLPDLKPAEPRVRADVPTVAAPIEALAETPAASDPQKTMPFAPPAPPKATAPMGEGGSPAREVSVEELLDLEQQADFFIALGQEDAAGELLMSHLRSTGGLSPLPYTKLLEIYRRQGDRTAYERIRARFNRRFNVYAPDWDVGPMHGRSLEDYPEVIQRLQELWPSHLNAMAVLEAMLFRNDERQELFDLPAYKDVLLLYSLARDLYQQSGVTAADVDLLLPLGDEEDAHVKEPLPGAERVAGYDMTAFTLEGNDAPGGGPSGGGAARRR